MVEQPTGTVTLLFTDIEGSTRLLERLGPERYREALELHRTLLRQAFERHGGYEVDYEGDAFFVAFSRAADAVAAAEESQIALDAAAWPEGLPIRVRMGLHTGEPLAAAPKYVGLDVHKAARIMASGHGGQVLVSASTQRLVGPAVPLVHLGEHRLKDLSEPEPLYQLCIQGLPAEFPALKTLGNRPTNLPTVTTPFVGRLEELGAVKKLLLRDDVRLLTLTGVGGIGKTRLALQAAANVVDHFDDGVYWVPLASVRAPDLVFSMIARTLGVREEPGEPTGQTVARHLGEKRLLLLLDNFEHVIGVAAGIGELLRMAPGVRVVTTSREPLRISGEYLYDLAPLAIPDSADDLRSIEAYDAVQLFVQRAAAADDTFSLSSENAPVVATIIRRLEGLPLALELAAARVRTLPPSALVARLGDALALLTTGNRDVDARQRTLLATIRWSYDLLDPAEQKLFAHLAVFVGGFRLEAAEHVCNAGTSLGVVDGIASLLNKSLLRRRIDHDGEPRYWMLETIRQFAEQQLSVDRDGGSLRLAHARYYARFAREASNDLRVGVRSSFERMGEEYANIRAAIEFSLAEGALEVVAEALYGTWFYLLATGGSEARFWAERYMVADHDGIRDADELAGLLAVSEIVRWSGEHGYAAQLKNQGVALIRRNPAEELYGTPMRNWLPPFLSDLATWEADCNRFEVAERNAREAVDLRRAYGHHGSGLAHALGVLAYVRYAQEDFASALAILDEADHVDEDSSGDLAMRRLAAAECALYTGDADGAAKRFAGALALDEPPNRSVDVFLLRTSALLAERRGDAGRATELLGAADRLKARIGSVLLVGHEIRVQNMAFMHAREELGSDYEAAYEALTVETYAEAKQIAEHELTAFTAWYTASY